MLGKNGVGMAEARLEGGQMCCTAGKSGDGYYLPFYHILWPSEKQLVFVIRKLRPSWMRMVDVGGVDRARFYHDAAE
jgi:hypothetical protein